MAGNFELGQIVESIAGRDKNDYYVVIGIGPMPYLYLADGVKKKVEKAKKKNIKHIRPLPYLVEDIKIKCRAGMRITNFEIANALNDFLGENLNDKEVK